MGLWVTPQTTHITSTHVVGRKRSEATEEVCDDRPVTGDFDGRSGDGRSGNKRLRRVSRRRMFGGGQAYRGDVGETQQLRARKSITQSEFSDGDVRASPSMLSTRLIQTARARGIDRTGPVDLAGKGRTCASHWSLRLCHCAYSHRPKVRTRAARTDGKQGQPDRRSAINT